MSPLREYGLPTEYQNMNWKVSYESKAGDRTNAKVHFNALSKVGANLNKRNKRIVVQNLLAPI